MDSHSALGNSRTLSVEGKSGDGGHADWTLSPTTDSDWVGFYQFHFSGTCTEHFVERINKSNLKATSLVHNIFVSRFHI